MTMANALQEPVSADDLLPDLTSERSAFIAEAQREGRIYIQQPYERYSEENHRSWGQLYQRMQPRWERHANSRFLEGLDRLHLDADRVPHLEDVNRFLSPLTGFTTRPVSGFVPAFLFFDCLHRREFPTTVTMRDGGAAFAPWPDIFHDITGHVPMHTDPAFADALVRFGDCAHTAVARTSGIKDREEKIRRLSNMIRAMARFFWFTVETGLMREGGEVKVYGSAMLSSYGEIEHCLDTSLVQQYPIQLEWVINQSFLPNYYQPLLFIVDSFSHLYDLVDQLERWMREGRLDNVAPGEPGISEEDLQSFLNYAEK
jgi:phenylalanine-4-hydroxylase